MKLVLRTLSPQVADVNLILRTPSPQVADSTVQILSLEAARTTVRQLSDSCGACPLHFQTSEESNCRSEPESCLDNRPHEVDHTHKANADAIELPSMAGNNTIGMCVRWYRVGATNGVGPGWVLECALVQGGYHPEQGT